MPIDEARNSEPAYVPWADIANRASSGLTLIDAALHYSPDSLKPALSKVKSWVNHIREGVAAGTRKKAGGREDKIAKAAIKRYEAGRRAALSSALHLRDALMKGVLVGVGYISPRTLLSEPVIIPANAWGVNRYEWRQSKLRSQGDEYVYVKIYRREDCPDVKAPWKSAPPVAPPDRKRRGAPGFERYTHQALETLWETPGFRAAKTHKQRADLIKAAVSIPDQAERDRYMETDPKTLAAHYKGWKANRAAKKLGK